MLSPANLAATRKWLAAVSAAYMAQFTSGS